jgi:hypothetical protein
MSRGRKKVIVDKDEFQKVINDLEKENSYKNMSQLFKAVEKTDWAKGCKDEDGNPKPLKSQTAYNRFKDLDLDSKTKKGKTGRGGISEAKEKEVVKLDPSQVMNQRLAASLGANKVTRIPAGECPVKLKGVEREDVWNWCRGLQEHYLAKSECLSPEGMAYFVNYCFYNSTTKEYKKVAGYIHEWVEVTLGVIETVATA